MRSYIQPFSWRTSTLGIATYAVKVNSVNSHWMDSTCSTKVTSAFSFNRMQFIVWFVHIPMVMFVYIQYNYILLELSPQLCIAEVLKSAVCCILFVALHSVHLSTQILKWSSLFLFECGKRSFTTYSCNKSVITLASLVPHCSPHTLRHYTYSVPIFVLEHAYNVYLTNL